MKDKATFLGYRRPDGRPGIRNHVFVAPTVVCTNAVVDRIARAVPEVATITHPYGCTLDPVANEEMTKVFASFAASPNVHSALFIALGCETVEPLRVVEMAKASGKRVELVTVQDEGDTELAFQKAVAIARELVEEANKQEREEFDVSRLVIGLECGSSDAFSGLTANPALGLASDMLVDMGATMVISEITEYMGAEHIAAAQAVDDDVRKKVLETIARTEGELAQIGPEYGFSDITPGNMLGGLTTIEEKSLGCIRKGGTRPYVEVVGYGEIPTKHGLVMMDTPGQDIESLTGLIAGGTHAVVFTTGRGTPTGSAIAPIIKLASNSNTFNRMRRNIDLNAGGMLDGTKSIEEVAEDIVEFVLEVASGKQAAAEVNGHREFGLRRRGATGCIY
ncbi:MAG TPA: UxaA family hydrolase [Bacillota bacterium]|nr:UxaA family hydrolase [Bacillota bacterium]HOH09594.1 UxaA family hydrolase [Bacillota bacterium]HOS49873.1 UxaA family hydrolase [Bacillota bacterium]HQJ23969.1 UxaA family hydrolase [Bacillota bacterium]